MLMNYLKTAWRSILKSRFYTLIHIAGLALGLTVGLLILIWVQHQLSFDDFFPNRAQIYRLENMGGTGSSRQLFPETTAAIATAAKRNLPEVADAVRIDDITHPPVFLYHGKKYLEPDHAMTFIDPSFFSVFGVGLIRGNPRNPFPDLHSMVITESTARKFFGHSEPIGQVISDDHQEQFTVSGVIPDFPSNSSIRYDMLIPMQLLNYYAYVKNTPSYNGIGPIFSMDNDWVNFSYNTYLLLKGHPSIPLLEKKLRVIHLRGKPDDTDVAYLLEPLRKMHLYNADGSDGGIQTVRIFSIIAILILIIACINYVNLSTARAMLRARDISMRKIIGARRIQLFFQFILETAILFAISFILAVTVMYLLMPVYNEFSGEQLRFDLANGSLWLCIGATLVLTLALSSIYPALLLSSFEPMRVLKGRIRAGLRSISFRRILVVSQFAVSIVLIIGVLVIARQMDFVRHKNLGYDRSHVFIVFIPRLDRHYDAIRAQLLSSPGVQDVTRAGDVIVDIENWTGDNDWPGKPANSTLFMHPLQIDKNFIPFFGLHMAEGRNFTGSPADSARFILNETAVREMGLTDPVGKMIRIWKIHGTVIGVMKDFHFESLRKKIEAAFFMYDPTDSWSLYIRSTPAGTAQALTAAHRIWKEYGDDSPFRYNFLDVAYDKLYASEAHISSLMDIFAGIAIFISCLGLFALATYTAEVRTREMGIRKVLGASASTIAGLLSREFMKLVLAAILIGSPVAWWVMNKWLQGFSYRIRISGWIFVVAGLAGILIAAFTVSYQALRTAMANPVQTLRAE